MEKDKSEDVVRLEAELKRLKKIIVGMGLRYEMLDESEVVVCEGDDVLHSIGAMNEKTRAGILLDVARLCDIGNTECCDGSGPHDAVKQLFLFLHEFDGMFTFEELDDLLIKAADWLDEN